MKKSSLLFATLIPSALLSACSAVDSLKPFDQQEASLLLQQNRGPYSAKQMVSIALPKKETWKKTNFTPDEVSAFAILVPPNESPAQFTESIQARTIPYAYTPDVTAKKYVEDEIKQAKESCQQASATILNETPKVVMYRLEMNQCHNKKIRWQIGKVFNGTDGVYSIRYVADGNKITEERYHQLSQAVKTAELIRNPRASF